MIRTYSLIGLVLLTNLVLMGCERSTSQKVEDKMEDAGHEIKQGAERAGEKVEDATK
jgi:hypothetical protein